MKKISFLLPLFAFLLITTVSCSGGGGTNDPVLTLADQIKGKTFKLGNITETSNNGADANGKFVNFTIAFDAAGANATIRYDGDVDTGGSGVNATTTYSINGTTIQLGANKPATWTSGTLTGATFTSPKLVFSTILTSPKTGQKTFKFDLVQ